MTTIITPDGNEHKLHTYDAHGIDYSADLIGNTSHGMGRDDNGNYLGTVDDVAWWNQYIEDVGALNTLISTYQDKYPNEDIQDYLDSTHALDTDPDNQLSSARLALSQLDVSSAAVTLGRMGGSSTSKAKQAAARENGRKGGRPRK